MEDNASHDNGNAAVPVGPPPYAREYDMNHRRRGKAIIFSHYEYLNDNIEKREGNSADEDRLYYELIELDFEVIVMRDRLMKGIMNELKILAKEDHTDADCLVIVIMSHGREKTEDEDQDEKGKRQSSPKKKNSLKKKFEVLAMDKFYDELDLFTPFNGRDCPTLRGKPKLFFIQACRGIEEQAKSKLQSYKCHRDGSSNEPSVYWVPDVADFLVVRATFNGTFSYRHEVEGTVFIQALCEVFEENRKRGNPDDLNTLLLFLNGMVARRGQMPFVMHTLTRLIYFRPKPNICDQEETDKFE